MKFLFAISLCVLFFSISWAIYDLLKISATITECNPDVSTLTSGTALIGLPNPMISDLGPYLAGLVESDGWIITPKSERFASGKLCYPSIGIAFNLKDQPLADYLCDHFGHGSVHITRSSDQAVE